MSRRVPEWVGATDDAAIPLKVRIRVFERYEGKCALTGKRLMPGEYDIDHRLALKDGGEHRESNLQPVWRGKHREKTAGENRDRAKVERIKDKHYRPRKTSKLKSRNTFKAYPSNTRHVEHYD
jgi:5-methylcytosine-specific restriction endonuclease McrA